MRKITIVLILMKNFDNAPCKNLASFFTTIVTITSDNEKALTDYYTSLNKNSDVFYIDTQIIKVSSTNIIKLSG